MKKLLLLSLAAACFYVSRGQEFSEFTGNAGSNFTMSSDNNTLQIGGRVGFYYEYRALKPVATGAGESQPKLDKDGFQIKDIDLDILGKTSSKFVYEVHMSIVDLATAAATLNAAAPTNPGIKCAYLEYVGIPVHIKLGFDKLPFSLGSISDVYATPMWSHSNLAGGDLFSRRDLGLTLSYSTWKNRINAFAGIYSGMGENVFEYGQDNSGSFEYVGRVEFCYPGKMTYHNVDEEMSPTPQFRIGLNGRYENKAQPLGQSNVITSYPDEVGAYDTRMVDGKRSIYGGDVTIKYKGFSGTFEDEVMNMQPVDGASDPLFNGTSLAFNKGIVMAGGWVGNIMYNSQKLHSTFSVQYEEVNANDLIAGNQQWLNFAYAYKISGFNSVAKIEYYIPEKEDDGSNPLKYTSQLRVGYEVVF